MAGYTRPCAIGRTSGLGLVSSVTAICRFCSSVAFGVLRTVAALILRGVPEQRTV